MTPLRHPAIPITTTLPDHESKTHVQRDGWS